MRLKKNIVSYYSILLKLSGYYSSYINAVGFNICWSLELQESMLIFNNSRSNRLGALNETDILEEETCEE